MRVALKVDVDTYRGTVEGVPRLVKLLKRYNAGATFLFSLGPDHTGRAIKRIFRPGFFGKVARTSVVEHYGIKTLLYGTVLPGPNIAKRCASILRSVRDAGFEVGVHCYDHIRWQDHVVHKDAAWTRREMDRAFEAFEQVFDEPARTHGAAGWQINDHALAYEVELGLDYCSDTRGGDPFAPVVNAQPLRCLQLPSTLPTLDELIGLDGLNESNVADHILELSAPMPPYGHVYTLHAEMEGMKLLPVFEKMLQGWQKRGVDLVATREIIQDIDYTRLPSRRVFMAEIPGRSGTVATTDAFA